MSESSTFSFLKFTNLTNCEPLDWLSNSLSLKGERNFKNGLWANNRILFICRASTEYDRVSKDWMRKVLCTKIFNFVLEGCAVILLNNEFMHLAFLFSNTDNYMTTIDLYPAECVLLHFLIVLKKVFLMLELQIIVNLYHDEPHLILEIEHSVASLGLSQLS
jgi:hypothetical protein